MGTDRTNVVPIVEDDPNLALVEQFVVRMCASWEKFNMPKVDLAKAMLTSAINTMIDEDGAAEPTAKFLAALAVRLDPTLLAVTEN